MVPITCSILTGLALASSQPVPGPPMAQPFSFRGFGTLTLYRPAGPPSSVVVFISGDGGWNLGVLGMAERLRARGALVIGVDIRRYFASIAAGSSRCTYAAADFEALSQFVQKRLGLDHYLPPVLVGYSSGATLAYVVLAQAPPNTFKGAISLGFCPDLPVKRAWCPGSGGLRTDPLPRGNGWQFQPAERLPAPWIVLQGDDDQVCPPAAAAEYVAKIPLAQIVRLPLVGHGFGVERRWGDPFDRAFQRLVAESSLNRTASAGPVSDLPLIEVNPEPGAPAAARFAIMLSGDGGWAEIDRAVSQRLAARGIPVVGLNSLQYFWKARSPEEVGRDLARVIAHYRTRWSRDSVLLLGYSFGADVLPAAIALIPEANRSAVAGVGLLGLGQGASFEFHVAEWIGRGARDEYPTWPALKALPGLIRQAPVACLFGAEETDTGCRPSPGISAIRLSGGHHLGGDFDVLADRLLTVLGTGRP